MRRRRKRRRRRKIAKCLEEKEKEKKISRYPIGSDNERYNILLDGKKYLNPCTGRLPDATFPSDHLSIKANFAFLPSP